HALSENKFPIVNPLYKKNPQDTATVTVVNRTGKPINAAPIPAPKASSDKAVPSNTATHEEIFPELSTSARTGLFNISITNPSFLISKCTSVFFFDGTCWAVLFCNNV